MLCFIYYNAECQYAECNYAECHGAHSITWSLKVTFCKPGQDVLMLHGSSLQWTILDLGMTATYTSRNDSKFGVKKGII